MNPLPTRRGLHTAAIGGAWFFIIASLLHLAWVVAAKIDDPGGLATLYQTSVGDETYRAWGLAYEGVGGMVRAIIQASAVIAAAVLTLVPWMRGRRIAHVMLLTWSAWWAANLLWLAGLDGRVDSILQATLLTALTGCTGYRAWREWGSRRSAPPAAPAPIVEVQAAARLLEDPPSDTVKMRRVMVGARRAGATLGRGVAAGTRQARSGVCKGIGYLRARGVLPTQSA